MITRAHAVALPTGVVLSLSKDQLPSLHETSLPEPLHLIIGLVPVKRCLVNAKITHFDQPIDRDQWFADKIIGQQGD
jgi:hypothetical protein